MTIKFFSEVPEGQAIILASGVYRQVKLAVRDMKLYAAYGSGWVRLSQGGSTSHPKVRWHEVDTPNGTFRETQGFVEYRGE